MAIWFNWNYSAKNLSRLEMLYAVTTLCLQHVAVLGFPSSATTGLDTGKLKKTTSSDTLTCASPALITGFLATLWPSLPTAGKGWCHPAAQQALLA